MPVHLIGDDGSEYFVPDDGYVYVPENKHDGVDHGRSLTFLSIGDLLPSGNGAEVSGFVLRVAEEIGWLGTDSGPLMSGYLVFILALHRVNFLAA